MSQAKKPGYSFYRTKAFQLARKRAQQNKNTIVIELVDYDKILISGPQAIFTPAIKQEIRKLQGHYYDEERGWILPRNLLTNVQQLFKKQTNIQIYDIPKFVYKILQPFQGLLMYKSNKDVIKLQYSNSDKLKQIIDLPENFQKKLYSFQKKGVNFGIKNFGRILIADEMGVGKTAQALALASLYKSDWPFVVFVPSSLRFVWKEEILNWFEDFKPEDVQVITKSSQPIEDDIKALIISYDLGTKMAEGLKDRFNIAIADEAYYLKNSSAKRTEVLLPLIQKCRRCLLLAGTPALARPREIYNLLYMLRPDVFSDFKEFGRRYCNPSRDKGSTTADYSGASNLKELHYILTNSVMIRRLKKDVLAELPIKIRQKIPVETDSTYVKALKQVLSGNEKAEIHNPTEKLTALLRRLMKSEWPRDDEEFEQEVTSAEKQEEITAPEIFECYRYTGLAKLEGVRKFIKEMLQEEGKVLIFGHHAEVLDGIEDEVSSLELGYIRIDGKVPTKKRYDFVKSFQEDENIKVGILSLTAAGLGLTLTAATRVIFAEMYWTPAIMLQAEDRIHRIGQKEKVSVNYYYLYGEDTMDTVLYKILQRKIAIVSEILEGETEYLDLDQQRSNLVIEESQITSKKMEIEEENKQEENHIWEIPDDLESNKNEENESEGIVEEVDSETFNTFKTSNRKKESGESAEVDLQGKKGRFEKKMEGKALKNKARWDSLNEDYMEENQEEDIRSNDKFWDGVNWDNIEKALKEERINKGEYTQHYLWGRNKTKEEKNIGEDVNRSRTFESSDTIEEEENPTGLRAKMFKYGASKQLKLKKDENYGKRAYFRKTEEKEEEINKDKGNRKMVFGKKSLTQSLFESQIDEEVLLIESSDSNQNSQRENFRKAESPPQANSFAEILGKDIVKYKNEKNDNMNTKKTVPVKNIFGGVAHEIAGFRRNLRTLSDDDSLFFGLDENQNKPEQKGKLINDNINRQSSFNNKNSKEENKQNKTKEIKRVRVESEEEDDDNSFFGILKKIK